MAAEVAILVQGEQWDRAAEVYTRLIELDPEDNRWSEGLKQVEKERGLARRYAEGLGAMQQMKWAEAQRAFADVAYERPTYKEAAELLASATRQGKSEPAAAEMQPNAWLTIFGRRSIQLPMIVAVPLLLLGFGTWVGMDKLFREPQNPSTPTVSIPTLPTPDPSAQIQPALSVPTPALSLPAPRILAGHKDKVWSVTFSPDGQLLASGGVDGIVGLSASSE